MKKRRLILLACLVGLGAVFVPSVAAEEGAKVLSNEPGYWLPSDGSSYGADIDWLFYFIFWVVTAVFIGTEGLLLYFCFRYRDTGDGGEKATYTHGNHTAELVWTITPGLILAFLAFVQIGTWNDIKQPSEPTDEDEVIQVFAQQFNWFFRYAGPDGEFDTDDDFVLQELHMPVDTKVYFDMRSADVIHSLFLPNLRFKQDVVPGMHIRAWTKAIRKSRLLDEAERKKRKENSAVLNLFYPDSDDLPVYESREAFDVVCTELCGLGHYRMGSRLYIHPRNEYELWVKNKAKQFAEYLPMPDAKMKWGKGGTATVPVWPDGWDMAVPKAQPPAPKPEKVEGGHGGEEH